MKSNNRIKNKYFKRLDEESQSGLTRRSTVIQRKKAVNYFVKFLNSNQIKLKEISGTHILSFTRYLAQKQTKRGGTLAPSTIKQIYALSKTFYAWCYEEKSVIQPPDRIFIRNLLKRYKLGDRKLPKYIDQEKMSDLLDGCPEKWKALLHFMYETGARIGEVLDIQLDDIDYKGEVVQIYEPKTRNFRITSLSEKTMDLIKEYIKTYRRTPRSKYESYLFINQQRRKMTIRAVQFLVERLSIRIIEKKISPHYFRAACAVHLLEEGVGIRQVQEIIGWKSLSVVQNYTRVTPHQQTKLKKEYHPSFRKPKLQEQKQPKQELQPDITVLLRQMTEQQRQMNEERQRNQQGQLEQQREITELRQQVSQLIKLLSEKQS